MYCFVYFIRTSKGAYTRVSKKRTSASFSFYSSGRVVVAMGMVGDIQAYLDEHKRLTRIAFRFCVYVCACVDFCSCSTIAKTMFAYMLCFFVALLSHVNSKFLNVYLTNGWYTFPAGSSSKCSNSIGPNPPGAGIIRGGSCSAVDCYDARIDVAPAPVASRSTACRSSRYIGRPPPVHL